MTFNGFDARDGWWILGAALVMVAATALLAIRKRSGYAWLAFIASVVMGAIAVGDYRGVGSEASSIAQRMNIIGNAQPGIGLTLVAAAALAAFIGSLVAVAATPSNRP
jgi:formate/nitrite transporter FocA (FNT family)